MTKCGACWKGRHHACTRNGMERVDGVLREYRCDCDDPYHSEFSRQIEGVIRTTSGLSRDR